MELKNIIVAIDGYSACGKSTVAKALAKETGYLYIDSGAMYRAITLYMLNNNVRLQDIEDVRTKLEQIKIDLEFRNNRTTVNLNDIDVSDRIRDIDVSNSVPFVSAIKDVREKLTIIQRRMGNNKNIIMDGRDIGSVIFPHAQVKIFMTAKPRIRAERRYQELILKNPHITIEHVLEDLNKRDFEDKNRKESPLLQAADAIILDNSSLTEKDQLDIILKYINDVKSFTQNS